MKKKSIIIYSQFSVQYEFMKRLYNRKRQPMFGSVGHRIWSTHAPAPPFPLELMACKILQAIKKELCVKEED